MFAHAFEHSLCFSGWMVKFCWCYVVVQNQKKNSPRFRFKKGSNHDVSLSAFEKNGFPRKEICARDQQIHPIPSKRFLIESSGGEEESDFGTIQPKTQLHLDTWALPELPRPPCRVPEALLVTSGSRGTRCP